MFVLFIYFAIFIAAVVVVGLLGWGLSYAFRKPPAASGGGGATGGPGGG